VRGRDAWGRAGLVVLAVIAVDQATKAIVRSILARGEARDLVLGVDLVNVRNRGVAFGALADGGLLVPLLTFAALGLLLAYFATHASRPGLWLPVGMLLGGALGNLIDRVTSGAVTDFIDLPLWPAFNVADMSITLGVLVLIYVLERPRGRRGAQPDRA